MQGHSSQPRIRCSPEAAIGLEAFQNQAPGYSRVSQEKFLSPSVGVDAKEAHLGKGAVMEPAQKWAAPGAQALPPVADWRPVHH